jgi:hypothetical protein
MSPTLENPGTKPEVTLTENERQRCEVWTRVMGYHRPVDSFNIGKQGEWSERKTFVVCDENTGNAADEPTEPPAPAF